MFSKNRLNAVSTWLVVLAFCASGAMAQQPAVPTWQATSLWPDRIIVTLDQDPKTTFSVSWRTDASVTQTRAEVIAAEAHSRFDLGASVVEAQSQTVNLKAKEIDGTTHSLQWNTHLDSASYHTAQFSGLNSDTLYAYRVMGAEGYWSEWLQTRTAPENAEPFTFLYFGDAQDGLDSHWARVIRAAYRTAPDSRFAIHAGDLVNFGSRDYEWAAWFKSVSFIHGMIPALPVAGNHEYYDGIRNPEGGQLTALSLLWRPQFALPTYADLPPDVAETVYATRYGNTLIVTLDTMADQYFAEQAQWLDNILAASDARWKVVAMHHPLFELLERNIPGVVDTGPERRSLFLPIIEKHGVDIILQGHDHAYGRGAIISRGGSRAGSRRQRISTVYVSTSSGAKMYGIKNDAWRAFADTGAVLQRQAENTQFFQVIRISNDAITYEAFTATKQLYDAFRIEKQSRGPNRLIELPTDLTTDRTFENTGEYVNGRYDIPPEVESPQ